MYIFSNFQPILVISNMSDDVKDDFMDMLSIVDKIDCDNTEDDDEFNLDTLDTLSQDEIEKRVQVELLKTIGFNTQVIKEIRDSILVGGDAEYMDAFAKVSKSNADAIKILSELSLQKERLKSQKELKEMDLDAKKQLLDHKSNLELGTKKSSVNNTFILEVSREEIFDRILGKEKEDSKPKRSGNDIIDVTPEE